MGATLSQIFALLTTDAGRLTYHLVLAFSILGALYISLNQSPRQEVVQHRRLVFGFVLLLVFQLALFFVSGLAWQQVIEADVWLPLLERAVTLLSLIIIAWMWAFPDSSPGADMAAVLLILLTITSAVLGALWWQEQASGMDFNGSLPDKIAQAAALVIIFVGCLAIVSRRPVNWTLGLWMLLILAAGHAVQLFLLKESGDYPAVVRLAQMAAFSFLFALPLRLMPLPVAEDQAEPGEAQSITPASRLYADPQLWQSLPRLVSETDPERVCQTITSTVAKLMGADLCLLTMPPDESGKVVVRSGYDLVSGRYLDSLTLDSHSLPMLTSSLRLGRIRRLSIHGTSPDMAGLARAYNLEHTGNMLFLPVLSSDGHPLAGIIMLSPYSGKDWSHEEQSFLSTLAKFLVQFLQRSQEITTLKGELTEVRQSARSTQNQAQQVLEEKRKLQDQLAVMLERAEQDRAQLLGMNEMTSAHTVAQELIETLQAENEGLKTAIQQAGVSAKEGQQSVEGELRLALQEIAFLKSTLDDTDRKLDELKAFQPGGALSKEQLEVITSIAQDLRQPLSSIAGYAEVLLGELVGILTNQQHAHANGNP